ncbi:uncharacterized protein CCR75_002116 [Bremia lactucae]|uniref:Endonuclease/exonuclease/phosphatase domain-containing protein n=1 Tax=Bremia lactucae TaxID=4779 RepID=A0A976FD17_BRELC|nr:hypothetical protein CCR75_002116 [Bremia lactucae]
MASRSMVVTSDACPDCVCLTCHVYAPTDHDERENLLLKMADWSWPLTDIVVTGDFNSVQSHKLDRYGGLRSGRPKSAALSYFTANMDLEDARILAKLIDENSLL